MENRLDEVMEAEAMETVQEEAQETNEVVETDVKTLRPTKWIVNEAEGSKKCEACGAVMRGWAYRELFDYCPKCGKKAEKAV